MTQILNFQRTYNFDIREYDFFTVSELTKMLNEEEKEKAKKRQAQEEERERKRQQKEIERKLNSKSPKLPRSSKN